MQALDKYSEIRPYQEDEVLSALTRIAKHPLLTPITSYLFPTEEPDKMSQLISSLKSVEDFQDKVMFFAIKKIILDTSSSLSYAGLDKLKNNKKHLYISNHRDILLDSGIIQVILHSNNIQTSEMAVGDNLITDPFIEDIARSNKMIRVERGKNARELYHSSMLLSNYIRKRISGNESSVWIAQRNGRTKDGVDLTEQGLLKMLEMSGSGDFAKDFDALSIIPISVSYEFEPCDLLKTKELYISRRRKYVKVPGEDLNSILAGIMQYKGNVHIHFSQPLSFKELSALAKLEKNEKFKALAETIDNRIISSYQLWKNNYIAYDLLFPVDKYSSRYTLADKNRFVDYVRYKLSDTEGDPKEMEEIFLSIYANPVLSKEKII